MNALVIAPQPFFTPRGTPISVYYRTLVAAEQGVEVDLLTYGRGQDVDIPGVRLLRIPSFKALGPVKVGPSWLKLFLDVVLFGKAIRLLLTRRYDLVHVHEEAVFFCLVLQPFFRFRYLYDMHSSLPQQLTNFQFTRSRWLIRLFERLEDRALRRAHAVITVCDALYRYADPKVDDPERHVLIENSLFEPIRTADPSNAADVPAGAADEVVSIPPDRRLVVYAGTLEPYQGIDLALQAMARVAARRRDVLFLVAGGTPSQVAAYTRQADALGLGACCVFTGSVSRTRAAAYLRRADVLLSPRIAGTNTPLKIYEQLASGRPLVATRIEAHTQVLTDDVAFLTPPEPDAFAEGILCALGDTPAREEKVRNAQALYRQFYDREQYTRKMQHVLATFR